MATRPAVEITAPRRLIAGWLADRSLTTKSLAAGTFAAVIAMGVGGLAMTRLAALNEDIITMKTVHVDSMEQLAEFRRGTYQVSEGMLRYLFAGVYHMPDELEKAKEFAKDGDVHIDRTLVTYSKIAGGSERIAALETFADAQQSYRVLRDAVVFGEAPPPGVTLPPLAEQATA